MYQKSLKNVGEIDKIDYKNDDTLIHTCTCTIYMYKQIDGYRMTNPYAAFRKLQLSLVFKNNNVISNH